MIFFTIISQVRCQNVEYNEMYARRTRSFFRNKNATCNSARMNKFDFTTEKIGSVYKTVFEIVAPRNVDNWIQLLT